MGISISPMERVAVALGVYDGGADTLTFTPGAVSQNDELLVLAGWDTDAGNLMTPPTGWSELAREVAGGYTWACWGKLATEEDAEAELSYEWGDVTTAAVGVVAAYRGGVTGDPLIAYIDALDALENASGTSHTAPTLGDGTTQTTDILLSLMWFVDGAVTVTVNTLPTGAELLASDDAAEGRRRAFEHGDGLIGAQGGGFTCDTSGACVSTAAIVGLRARRPLQPAGVSDVVVGHVGLARPLPLGEVISEPPVPPPAFGGG